MNLDIEQIFQTLQQPDTQMINKQFFLEILVSLKLNTEQPEYFRFIFNQISKIKQATLSKQDLTQIFQNQNVQYDQLSLSDLTFIFKGFDKEKKGTFSDQNFIELYKQTDEYQKSSKENQLDVIKQIQTDFSYLKTFEQEITPIEFYQIMSKQYN